MTPIAFRFYLPIVGLVWILAGIFYEWQPLPSRYGQLSLPAWLLRVLAVLSGSLLIASFVILQD